MPWCSTPSLTRTQVRHVEIVALNPRRLMVVVISTTGRVEQRTLDIAVDLDDESIAELRNTINEAVDGKRLSEIPDAAETVAAKMAIEVRPTVAAVIATMVESLAEESERAGGSRRNRRTSRTSTPTSLAASSPSSRRSKST